MKRLQLPFGVQDYMPRECENKQIMQDRLASVFRRHGFVRVGLPAIEYADVYADVLSRDAVQKTFKMVDTDGSLLMLRSDPTLQICRMAAAKSEELCADKVYYIENSYEYISDPSTARSREFAQAGVELLGTNDTASDIEAIVVAIESLAQTGLTDFMVEIGHVGYYNGLAAEAGLQATDATELRGLINKKDMLGVEMFLKSKSVNERFVTQFMQLPTLFGDVDVLSRARENAGNAVSNRALDAVEDILSALQAMGLEKYVSVDLGLLRGEYYTGLVMKGFSGRLGVPILDGGRYDAVGKAFGIKLPAVGFSIGVKRLLMALEKEDKLEEGNKTDYAYVSDDKDYAFEYKFVSDLRNSGHVVEKCFCSKEELLEYCKQKGIANAIQIRRGTASKL